MLETVLSYEDWRDFFRKKLSDTGNFKLSNSYSKGNADTEIYSALKNNPDTTIEIGYLSSMTLIYMYISNPATPGKNRQQEVEHFYKYDFDVEKQYGPPGLEFNEINVKGISNYLDEGFNGLETVYYRKNKPIKSRVTTNYYPDSPALTLTYHFNEEPFYIRLLKKLLFKKENYDEIRNIDLRNIFGGLKDT